MKILICEDEEIMLTALEYRLRKQGFDVILAEDGKQALQKIQEESPDILVADIMMPYITGLELVQFIRQELKSTLPVIVISALEHDDVVLEAFRLGATDFITKPFKPNELILRIKRIFQEMELSEQSTEA
ncbi:MAG: response regulator transcription factor [Bacteroidota bacterium]